MRGKCFSSSASKNGMTVQTCAEENDLTQYGFIREDCVGVELAKRMTGKEKFKPWKARHNKCCKCVEMVDIGVYNTCMHGCKYCYANYNEKLVKQNNCHHNPNSSLLIGGFNEDDIIKERKV